MKNLLKAGALFAAVLGVAAPATAEDVSLRLNWQLLGFHAPFYHGVEKGYYTDEGITLTINEGRGGAATAQAIGAGSDDFGIVDAGTVIVSVSRGIPIRTVMSVMNKGTFAVVSRTDAGIKTAKDLEGKTISVTAGDALTALFPAVIGYNQLDEAKIRFVNVDAASKVVAVLEGRAQATLGSVDAQSFVMEAQGVPASLLTYDELGVKLVGLTLVANESTIAGKSDLIARFVRATRRSFEDALSDPDTVVAAAVRAKPELDAGIVRDQMDASLALLKSDNTKDLPMGVGAAADWDATLDLLKTYQGIETDKSGADFFTNDYAQ